MAERHDTRRPTDPTTRRAAMALGLGLGVLLVDQGTKRVFEHWACGELICPLRNDELMLGIVGGSTAQVLLASMVGLALFVLWVRLARRRATVPAVAVALVVSGVVGNLVDRIVLGSVRDFLAFPGRSVVNVADLALLAGLVVAVAAVVRGTGRRTDPTRADGRPDPHGSSGGHRER